MNIEEKVKVFEESCQRLLQREITSLNKNIDFEIEKQIKDELEEYEKKEEIVYHKNLEKLEKDYNKQIYSLQMETKKEVLNVKKKLQKELRTEVEVCLKNFTNTPEYEKFLFNRIEETLQKIEYTENCNLGITNQDYQKYASQIQEKYSFTLFMIDEKYIGGCILEDKQAGIYMDNTIQNSIDEKFEND